MTPPRNFSRLADRTIRWVGNHSTFVGSFVCIFPDCGGEGTTPIIPIQRREVRP